MALGWVAAGLARPAGSSAVDADMDRTVEATNGRPSSAIGAV